MKTRREGRPGKMFVYLGFIKSLDTPVKTHKEPSVPCSLLSPPFEMFNFQASQWDVQERGWRVQGSWERADGRGLIAHSPPSSVSQGFPSAHGLQLRLPPREPLACSDKSTGLLWNHPIIFKANLSYLLICNWPWSDFLEVSLTSCFCPSDSRHFDMKIAGSCLSYSNINLRGWDCASSIILSGVLLIASI